MKIAYTLALACALVAAPVFAQEKAAVKPSVLGTYA
jgi:hypothetical protein